MKNENQKKTERAVQYINIVITLLKFKSAVISFGRALSIAPPIRNTADFNFKSVITLLILNSSSSFIIFILHLWFPLKSTFYLEISRFTFKISGTVLVQYTEYSTFMSILSLSII